MIKEQIRQCGDDELFRHESENVRALLYKDYSIKLHTHSFYEINIVLGGHGTHTIEKGEFLTSYGDVFVIPPKCAHAYTNTENLDVFHLLIKSDLIDRFTDKDNVDGFELLMTIEPFLRQTFNESLFLKLSHQQILDIQNELFSLLDGNNLDYNGSDSIRNHTALKIVYWFSHLLTLQMEQHKYNNTLPDKHDAIIMAIKYIHENYKDKIQIQDLCDLTFMSRSTFIRSFNMVCGCTPIKYLQTYRSKAALDMLKTNKNKTYVAHECGFYDLSHMNKSINSLAAQKKDV